MNLVSKFRMPFGGELESECVLRKSDDRDPVFTILIGENGTRKSYLLRQILDAALISRKSSQTQHDVEFTRQPEKVVAVSAFASDRFPTSPTVGDFMYMGRYRDGYAYIGPRTSRNLISRQHNSRQLILALLQYPERLEKLRKLSQHLRATLKVPPNCMVGLNVEIGSLARGSRLTLEEYVERSVNARPTSRFASDLKGFGDLASASQQLARALRNREPSSTTRRPSVSDSQIQLHFNWAEGDFDGSSISAEALKLGLRTGYLRPTPLTFGGLEDDALSSGQWALFCGTYILGLTACDKTLVLIDEPECGLHPQWQRNYMELTDMALCGLADCHVVVATHSSLLLSSLPAARSEVVALERHDNKVVAQHIEVPTGWDATDVIQEVFGADSARGPEITRAFRHLLSLVAGGRPLRTEFKAEVKRVGPMVERLPADDPLRVTFAALKDAASGR